MTADEASKALKIMLTADGFCSNCVWKLFEQFVAAFPEHKDLANTFEGKLSEYGEEYRRQRDELEDQGIYDQPKIWEINL